MLVEGTNVVKLVREILPGYRVAVNARRGDQEDMVGGVYRNAAGDWFAYSADVTDGAEDAKDAISILLDVLDDFDRTLYPSAHVHERPVSEWRIYLEPING